MAYKPDFVPGLPPWMTIPLPPVLPRAVKLPTRASGLKVPCRGLRCRRQLALLAVADLTTQGPYSALLRVGLAIPFLLPRPWWALTPPFHHHRGHVRLAPNTTAVFSLWRFPWGYPRRALPGTLPSWSPDFPRRVTAPQSSSHPHDDRIRLRAAERQRQTDPPNPPSCPHRRRPSAPWPMAETAVETPQAQDHPLRPNSQTGAHLG